jgi:hypothetical protein
MPGNPAGCALEPTLCDTFFAIEIYAEDSHKWKRATRLLSVYIFSPS